MKKGSVPNKKKPVNKKSMHAHMHAVSTKGGWHQAQKQKESKGPPQATNSKSMKEVGAHRRCRKTNDSSIEILSRHKEGGEARVHRRSAIYRNTEAAGRKEGGGRREEDGGRREGGKREEGGGSR